MKSIVVYFSQTGNTARVAQAIRQGIESVTGQCDLTPMKQAPVERLADYDLIALGCPVFFFREPANVRAFETSLPPLSGKHCVLFATHGPNRGAVFHSMAAVLQEKGLVVIGHFSCYGSLWLQMYPKPYFTDGHPDQQEMDQAVAFGRDMVERSRHVRQGETDLLPRYRPVANDASIDREMYPLLRVKMKLNRQKCRYPQCRLCVDNCPANGINLDVEPLVFRRHCLNCFHCERICPYGAIEADFTTVAKEAKAMIEANIKPYVEQLEAQGRFRRLCQVDMDTPMYQVYSQRPRFRVE